MCGRYENIFDPEDWSELFTDYFQGKYFHIEALIPGFKKLNIPPSMSIVTITKEDNRIFNIGFHSWGIQLNTYNIFNSRIETIASKKFWREIYDHQKCLIPMTAFYEWVQVDKQKIPFRLTVVDKDKKLNDATMTLAKFNGSPFAVPGIIRGSEVSLITKEPNDFMTKYHNRMPVILSIKDSLKYFSNDFEQNIKLFNQDIEMSASVGVDAFSKKLLEDEETIIALGDKVLNG